ncbi:MAG: hypothetical protein J5616_06670 [Bacteroidaceae bacterium]|nr:hypothetical protein [Bacteroidaceae bacterium]
MEKENKKKVNIWIVIGLVAGFILWFPMQRMVVRYLMPASNVVDLMIKECNKKIVGWELEPGMVVDTMKREGNNVYYCYTVDEGNIDMDAMEENQLVIKKNIAFDFIKLSGDEKLGYQRMADAHMNLIYLYKGSITGRTLELTFTSEDLDRIFNK